MGAVHLAERADDQYRQQVALKLLPRWSAGNERLVRRLLEERQILAALDHPDIARLLDGGVTPDGSPWFAMEYVDGQPIDRYCDERHLSIERRLELFCRVCAAVQHAHRNLVVHRDLKPANILVTAEGGVKLLDFGIAKLIASDAARSPASLTMTGERLMTPRYASPEQVRGSPITTASDVYSLGVLLHELLTGRCPYRLTTEEPHAVASAILEQEPERPSSAVLRRRDTGGDDGSRPTPERIAMTRRLPPAKLARRLRGDLDTIAGKAMQKDPARRYGTAEQLEADVRRHLAGLPVSARQESRLYRALKFTRRHRVGVGLAAGVALLVMAFGVVTAVQSIRIRAQAARIALERDRAEQVSGFLAGLFRTSDPYAGAAGALTARAILDSGAARIDRELAGQPEARAQMSYEMGRAYFGLGLRDRARRFLEVSLAIRRRASPEGQIELARTLDVLGLVRLDQGDLDGAERAYGEALALRRRLLGERHRDVARTLNGLSALLRATGRFADADSVSRAAVAIDEARSQVRRLDLAESLTGLAHAARARGDGAAARRLYRQALALRRDDLPEEHPDIARAVVDLAVASADPGEHETADSLFRYGLTLQRRLLGEEHPDVAVGETEHARLLLRRGRDDEADALYRHALAIADRLPAPHPLRATALLGLGRLLLEREELAAAEALAREALAIRQTALPPEHPHIADAQQFLGSVIMMRRRYVEAERYLRSSLDGMRAAFGDGDARTRAALARLVELYERSGQPRRAAARLAPDPRDESVVWDRAERVIVLPFRSSPAHSALADLRDATQDLFAGAFTGEGIPRAVAPPRVREALARAPRESDEQIATQLGAGLLLRGDVLGSAARLTIDVELVGVSGGEGVRARASGAADSLPYLVDHLVAQLLVARTARDQAELTALSSTSLPALRAYLAGMEVHRRGRSKEAAEQYFERAVFLDSSLTPALMALAGIGDLRGTRGFDESWKFHMIWKQRDRLGAADRALLVAHLGPRYPRLGTLAERIAAAESASRAAPHRVESWYILGENLRRYGSFVSHPAWERKAAAAFERAFALDSTRAATLDGLLHFALRAGDVDAVQRYANQYLAHNPDAESAEFVRWRAAVAHDDRTALAAIRRRMPGMRAMALQRIVMWSHEDGLGLDDGDSAAAMLLGRASSINERTVATNRMIGVLLDRGRPTEAKRLLADPHARFGPQQGVSAFDLRIYGALYWDGDMADGAMAAEQIEAFIGGSAQLPAGAADAHSAACALVHWKLASGDIAASRRLLADIRDGAFGAAELPGGATSICEAIADAQLARYSNGRDAAGAVEELDALLLAATTSRDMLYTVGNLVAARLFEDLGDVDRALEAVRRRAGWNAFLSTQLREEGRLAALAGDRSGAIRTYRHYLALRSAPEPHLLADVERVRSELERLEDTEAAGERRPRGADAERPAADGAAAGRPASVGAAYSSSGAPVSFSRLVITMSKRPNPPMFPSRNAEWK